LWQGPVLQGRQLEAGLELQCDVVVVGSGAGGATVATLLAEAGLRVIVLEEGPYVRPEDYQRLRPSESIRRLFREAGMMVALGAGRTPLITVAVGRAVGGSSILTGGVCFRIPGEVHHRWVHDLGLSGLSERELEPAYDEVERRMSVSEVPPALRSASTQAFVDGAAKLGIEMQPIARNTGTDCTGLGRCNFGCPVGAKRSVDISYLPSAFSHGARLVSDALVDRVVMRRGRAAGVRGRLLGGRYGASSHRFRVAARAVVLACGTLHTPGLLRASSVRGSLVGRNVTLHPAARLVAFFDRPLRGWDGALQSVYSDHYAAEGIKLVGVYTAVNVLAAGMPGVGPELADRVRRMPNLGVFGAMIHDEGGGRVWPGLGREPLLTYRMSARDLARLRRSFRILAEIALAAGAREVVPPVFGIEPVRTAAAARRLETDPIDPRRIECLAFHPLGSARIGRDARAGIVDADGECYAAPGLFVADGSILPTSIGVNSQVPIMALATRIAWRLSERLHFRLARRLP
jgi:choline dehydrogenase-like flavoprotein